MGHAGLESRSQSEVSSGEVNVSFIETPVLPSTKWYTVWVANTVTLSCSAWTGAVWLVVPAAFDAVADAGSPIKMNVVCAGSPPVLTRTIDTISVSAPFQNRVAPPLSWSCDDQMFTYDERKFVTAHHNTISVNSIRVWRTKPTGLGGCAACCWQMARSIELLSDEHAPCSLPNGTRQDHNRPEPEKETRKQIDTA